MKPYYDSPEGKIYNGSALTVLKGMADGSVQMCVTSPPYWGLRDYGTEPDIWDSDAGCEHEWGGKLATGSKGHPGDKSTLVGTQTADISKAAQSQGQFCQLCGAWRGNLGLEPTPELYVQHMVEISREVRRVLRDDGTLWLNLGDSYNGSGGAHKPEHANPGISNSAIRSGVDGRNVDTLKPKDLVGIPWMVAFALRADGWYLRSDIIWNKKNPMPESVTDRPTKAHEYLFLLSKSQRYYYDSTAIRENVLDDDAINDYNGNYERIHGKTKSGQAQGHPEIQSKQARKSETEGIQTNRGGEEVTANVGTLREGQRFSSQIQENGETESRAKEISEHGKVQENAEKIPSDGQGPCEPCERGPQAPIIAAKLHKQSYSRAVARDKRQIPSQMCLLPEKDGTVDDGPCNTVIEGGAPHCGEHSSGVSKLQFKEGEPPAGRVKIPGGWDNKPGSHGTIHRTGRTEAEYQTTSVKPGRNKRTVWTIATKPFPEAHFATFPPKLIEPCVLAGCPKGGTVLDPFFGSGTTGIVAYNHDRKFIGIELSKVYLDDIAIPRIKRETAQLKLF
tara:strand:+ start:580 stop:2265 length:1686 start_codon:yes stop_codon:yes gene_type:complete